MTSKIVAMIQGHPWDLWGLSKLFDGTDSAHTLVVAQKPKGLPTFDPKSENERNRFRVQGYDVFATLTSEELSWGDTKARPDLQDLRPIALNIIERMNGIAILLDPEYAAAKIIYLSYTDDKGGAGSILFGDWTPNKAETHLGRDPFHVIFSKEVLSLSKSHAAIKFVLDAIALPRTWASLYLIYEAIASDVGGVHKLRTMGWVTAAQLKDFSSAANNNRKIVEGARHGTKPQPREDTLLPLASAYFIINKLAVHWLDSLTPSTKGTP